MTGTGGGAGAAAALLPEPEALDAEAVLRCFERVRLPAPRRRGRAEPAADLAALAGRYDAFVLDGFGVINVGPEPIPGAAAAVRALRAAGKQVMALTNGAGWPSARTAARYAGWGVEIPERLVVSSRDALEAALARRARAEGPWGVMARRDSELGTFPAETLPLGADEAAYREARGFILASSAEWERGRHERLADALRREPRPVLVANADVSAPLPHGEFTAEPGYWALRLEAETGARYESFGKPFGAAFDLALERLGPHAPPRERIAMVGDGLYTDVLGALAAGLGAVLVTGHGLMKGLDWRAWAERAGIFPDYAIPGP